VPRHRFPDTRDRIERAAVDLFGRKGVAETSIRDIARAVDVSEGALYRHFVSKDDLVWRTFERHYLDFARRLEALAAGETGARKRIAAMIRGFCQAHDEDPALFRFLLFVQHGQLAKLPPGSPTPVRVMQAVIEDGMASGELPSQPAALATALVFGIVLQPALFAAYGDLSDPMGSISERLVAASWAAIATVSAS
jgi:AcrR family transcriptional regulator